jgi:acyl-CoA synthetase (AMP-forming)/AMP-acid ligase II/aryl carrier-like protein
MVIGIAFIMWISDADEYCVSLAFERRRAEDSSGMNQTLLDIIEAQDPKRLAYRVLGTIGDDPLAIIASRTVGELRQRAKAIAGSLVESRAESALLVFEDPLAFAEAFLACLYAKVAAVPTYAPDPSRLDRALARLKHVIVDAAPDFILTEDRFSVAAAVCGLPVWSGGATSSEFAAARPSAEEVAWIQYTSGSTSDPKGVVITHDNLMANCEDISAAETCADGAPSLSWLPFSHDMGLVEGLLHPLFAERTAYLMTPSQFLRRPMAWLEAISRYRVATTGAPNFAYALVLRERETPPLNLSAWKLGYNGAEPVNIATLEAFQARFAPFGLAPETLRPVYGLAEATLLASGGRAGKALRLVTRKDGSTWPVIGPACKHAQALIVDPDTLRACKAGEIGEIWLTGRSVARGFLHGSSPDFHARLEGDTREFLRTGDLGFIDEGELVLTGRHKDLIIVRGRNLYPQDIERVVEARAGVIPGGVAAFSLTRGGEESIGVVVEMPSAQDQDAAAIAREITDSFDAPVSLVACVAKGRVQKTTSGKLKRAAMRTAATEGSLATIAVHRPELALDAIVEAVKRGQNIDDLGLDSLDRVRLQMALEESVETASDSTERGLVTAHYLNPDSLAHHVIWWGEIEGGAVDTFSARFSAIQTAHTKLRTFYPPSESGFQTSTSEPQALDVRRALRSEWEGVVETWLSRPFSLASRAPFEALFVHDGDMSHGKLALKAHHALLDLRGMEIVVAELLGAGISHDVMLPRRRISRDAWRNYLKDAPPFTTLPTDPAANKSVSTTARPLELAAAGETTPRDAPVARTNVESAASSAVEHNSTRGPRAGVIEARLPQKLVTHLRRRCESERLTLFELTFAMHARWLTMLTGAYDFCIAVPMSLRATEREQRSVDNFVHLVPVRVKSTDTCEVVTSLRTARSLMETPYPDIVDALRPPIQEGARPFATLAFGVHALSALPAEALSGEAAHFGDVRISHAGARILESEHALGVTLLPDAKGARLRFTYDRALISDPVAAQWLTHWIASVAVDVQKDDNAQPTADNRWIGVKKLEASPLDVVALFRAHCARAGETLAIAGDAPLSYTQLDDASSRLAQWLQGRGLKANEVVGLCLEPSPLFVIATLAAWKLGAMIAAVSPEDPTPWLERQLEVLAPKLVLRDTPHTTSYPLETTFPTYAASEVAEAWSTSSPTFDAAKGRVPWRVVSANFSLVDGSWADVAHEIHTLNDIAPLSAGDVTLLRAPAGSYRAFLQLAVTLASGAATYVATAGDTRCPAWLADHLRDTDVSHVFATPSQLRGVLNAIFDAERRLGHVRHYLLDGEPLHASLRARLERVSPDARIHSLSGPLSAGKTLIANGIPTLPAMVASRQLTPLPTLASGRLSIDDALTEVTCRSLADGSLEVLDDPAHPAAMGVEISLDELRRCAQGAGALQSATSLTYDTRGERRLTLWYKSESLTPMALRKAVRAQLPPAYEPASILRVDTFDAPLPPPPWLAPQKPAAAPLQTEVEHTLAALVSSLLERPITSRSDDFFALGGDSLMVLHLSHAAKTAGLDLSPSQIATARTIEAMARLCAKS